MAVLPTREFQDDLADLEETRKAVENAETRARLHEKVEPKGPRRNSREFAQALHKEADELYHSGDYETALVLYHRAANVFPRDSSHSVAARRTAATISSWHNPPRALRKILPDATTEDRLTVALCPESAALKASNVLKKAPNPSTVQEVLSYFDSHKTFWKPLPSPGRNNLHLTRSRVVFRQLENQASSCLRNLKTSFESGKMSASLKSAQELLTFSSGLPDPSRYQIAAYHYLSLIHVSLGRHDRAVTNVSRLVRLSKSTGDVVQTCRSLVTLGKVHLSFGHLDAAAKAWEHLSKDLKEPIPLAWIRHEIGRCYLETGKYKKALEMALVCTEAAVKADSKKWMVRGKLLMGQCLAKMGRFAASLEELKVCAKISEREGDTLILSYVQSLIDQVTRVHRGSPAPSESGVAAPNDWKISACSRFEQQNIVSRSTVFTGKAETLLTTVFSQQRTIVECHKQDPRGSIDPTGDTTTRSDDVSTQRYTDNRSETSDDDDEDDLAGGSTFRIAGNTSEDDDDDTSASSTSSSGSADEDDVKIATRSNSESEKTTTRSKIDVDDAVTESGVVTLRSDTNLTYVIDDRRGNPSARTQRDFDVNDAEKTETKMLDETPGQRDLVVQEDVEGDAISQEAIELLNGLDKKNERELLEMLRDMLLATEEENRLQGSFAENSFEKRDDRDLGSSGEPNEIRDRSMSKDPSTFCKRKHADKVTPGGEMYPTFESG